MKLSYKHTTVACYIGYITQAIINIFTPLLFITFRNEYSIDLAQISLLIIINFITQIIVDIISVKYIAVIGERRAVIIAHIFVAAGLIGLGILPSVMNAFAGLVISVIVYAVGGGLIEVLVSPIVESVPSDNKSSAMSLLHSFYCWGSVLVVALSTLAFNIFGIENWHITACCWAVVPIFNAVYFTKVPINATNSENGGMKLKELLKNRSLPILLMLMLCAGASELAMSQWASAFAESALGVSKTVGDLLGPCFFAVLMGTARVVHSRIAAKVELTRYMNICALICVTGYVLASFSPFPLLSLVGCGVCGFAVGVMWPGTFTRATEVIQGGGTSMFALLALAGDLGCTSGPALVGLISEAAGDNLKTGLAFAIVFPVLLMIGLALLKRRGNKQV